MVAIDPFSVPSRIGTDYPAPFDEGNKTREKRALGNAFELSHFGVNLVRLPPGEMSSQRHWHEQEEEFVYVLSGELWLISDGGEQLLRPGMTAGFRAGVADGHHLVNRGAEVAVFLEIGTREPEDVPSYPDIDLFVSNDPSGRRIYVDGKGDPY